MSNGDVRDGRHRRGIVLPGTSGRLYGSPAGFPCPATRATPSTVDTIPAAGDGAELSVNPARVRPNGLEGAEGGKQDKPSLFRITGQLCKILVS